jgi:hypothetical protein
MRHLLTTAILSSALLRPRLAFGANYSPVACSTWGSAAKSPMK